jgi:hypothetical protein
MQQQQQTQIFPDYGLDRFGLAGSDQQSPDDWAVSGLREFGAYSSVLGILDDPGLLLEVDEGDTDAVFQGVDLVRTRMLELAPEDFRHLALYGRPRIGSVALGDDGQVYQYVEPVGLGWGFFKKLFKRVKKAVKGVVHKIAGAAKKLIKKLPGGKYLLKLYGKVHKIAMKLVRPLTKFVGKYAAKLAPVAALIPGYGPAIAAGLYTAGRIAKIMSATGVVTDKKGKPIFKSAKHAAVFKKHLEKAAKQEHEKAKKKKVVIAKKPERIKALKLKPVRVKIVAERRAAKISKVARPLRVVKPAAYPQYPQYRYPYPQYPQYPQSQYPQYPQPQYPQYPYQYPYPSTAQKRYPYPVYQPGTLRHLATMLGMTVEPLEGGF